MTQNSKGDLTSKMTATNIPWPAVNRPPQGFVIVKEKNLSGRGCSVLAATISQINKALLEMAKTYHSETRKHQVFMSDPFMELLNPCQALSQGGEKGRPPTP